jgi:hypothetical protein
MTQPHLVDGLDRVSRRLGGVTRVWRFDRMATVCHPDSGRVTASFAGVAKHYGVSVAICPPKAGNRKGVVEKANHTAAQRWWRTLPDDVTVEQAQQRVDEFCRLRGDTRMRATADGKASVATVAAAEPLTALPATPYPAILTEPRTASRQALVSYRGNRYSVPPELASAQVTVTQVLGSEVIDIVTRSPRKDKDDSLSSTVGTAAGPTFRTDHTPTPICNASTRPGMPSRSATDTEHRGTPNLV